MNAYETVYELNTIPDCLKSVHIVFFLSFLRFLKQLGEFE